MDVFDAEPLPRGHPLTQLPNVDLPPWLADRRNVFKICRRRRRSPSGLSRWARCSSIRGPSLMPTAKATMSARRRCWASACSMRHSARHADPLQTRSGTTALDKAISDLNALIGRIGFEDTAADLILLDGFEEGLEIALAKAVVTLALDELKEDRADRGFAEPL